MIHKRTINSKVPTINTWVYFYQQVPQVQINLLNTTLKQIYLIRNQNQLKLNQIE